MMEARVIMGIIAKLELGSEHLVNNNIIRGVSTVGKCLICMIKELHCVYVFLIPCLHIHRMLQNMIRVLDRLRLRVDTATS